MQISNRGDHGCSEFQFCPQNVPKMRDLHPHILYFWIKFSDGHRQFLHGTVRTYKASCGGLCIIVFVSKSLGYVSAKN